MPCGGTFPATISLMGESPSAADPRIPAAYRPGQFPKLRRRKISRVSGTRHTVRISRDRMMMPMGGPCGGGSSGIASPPSRPRPG